MKSVKSIKIILLNIFIIIFLSFYSCDNNYSTLQFFLQDTLVLNLPDSNLQDVYYCQEINNGDTTFLLLYFNNTPYLYLFNINSKEFKKKIPIYKYFRNDLKYQYINKDSIWIFGSSSINYNSDSSLMVIDDNGTIKHIIKLNHPKFVNTKNYNLFDNNSGLTNESFDTCIFLSFFNLSDLISNDNNIYFSCLYSKKVYNDIYNNKNNYPLYMAYNIKNNELTANYKLWFPETKNLYPRGYYHQTVDYSKSNDVLISFRYTPFIYKVSSNGIAEKIKCKSNLFDNNLDEVNNTNELYSHLIYCKKYNKYIRFFIPDRNIYSDKSIIITFDSNFNYIGETVFGIKKFSPFNINDHWFYFEIKNKKLYIIRLSLKWIKTNLKKEKNILNQIKEEFIKKYQNEICYLNPNNKTTIKYNINDYLKKLNIKDSTLCAIILHKDGCQTCNNEILEFIKMNQHALFKQKNLYVIYIAPNERYKNGLSFLTNNFINTTSNCIVDTSILSSYFYNNNYNPRLTLIRNNKIVSDAIYLPDNLDSLFLHLINFYNFEAEKKNKD